MERAWEEGQQRFRAEDWQGTIDALGPVVSQGSSIRTKQRKAADILIARAHRKLGHFAEALRTFDRALDAGPADPYGDALVADEREDVKRAFAAELTQNPPSEKVSVWFGERRLSGYRLENLECVLDLGTAFSDKAPENATFERPVTLFDATLAPGDHYLVMRAVYVSYPDQSSKFVLRSRHVFKLEKNGETNIRLVVVDQGGRLTPFGEGLYVEFSNRPKSAATDE